MQTTTTLNGRCTDDFDGTSAATPLVSGVMALALQAKYVCVYVGSILALWNIMVHFAFQSRTNMA